MPRSEAELEEEHALIEAAKKEPALYHKLYDRYFDQIYSYVFYHCGSREQAEDITAATFQRGLEDLPNFQWRGVPYSAWLFRVAANLLARDRRRPAWLELQDATRGEEAGEEPDEVVVRMDENGRLHEAIRALPPDQRQAILLRFFGGMRNQDVGRVMNRSEGAVKLLVFRGVSRLREQLQEENP